MDKYTLDEELFWNYVIISEKYTLYINSRNNEILFYLVVNRINL